jgi:hypothetical protein
MTPAVVCKKNLPEALGRMGKEDNTNGRPKRGTRGRGDSEWISNGILGRSRIFPLSAKTIFRKVKILLDFRDKVLYNICIK